MSAGLGLRWSLPLQLYWARVTSHGGTLCRQVGYFQMLPGEIAFPPWATSEIPSRASVHSRKMPLFSLSSAWILQTSQTSWALWMTLYHGIQVAKVVSNLILLSASVTETAQCLQLISSVTVILRCTCGLVTLISMNCFILVRINPSASGHLILEYDVILSLSSHFLLSSPSTL